MRTQIKLSKTLSLLVMLGIPLSVYSVILLLNIPYSITRFFSTYSPAYFLLVLFLFYICFHLPEKFYWIAGACLLFALFALTLSFLWTSGQSNSRVIGGILPYSDGFYYYSGARLMTNGFLLPKYSVQAAGRPLFPGFLASVLVLTNNNLQLTLAILVGFAGLCCYLSVYRLLESMGGNAATIYVTFLFFYVQDYIGRTYTEILGLAIGCLGFVMLWNAAKRLKVFDLVAGLVLLMLGVSVRAGAFFIFPMLIIWAGWSFRGQKRFNFRLAGLSLITIVSTYLVFNAVYSWLVVEPGNQTFGNFAYTLYGQVHGGTGYHRAIEELGRDPRIVYRETFKFFISHPLSFFIGAAKAYRDFFLPNIGVFRFYTAGGRTWFDIVLWIIGTLLLLVGFIVSIRKKKSPIASMLIATFIGIFLSIPFLPPIDSMTRFYASTMSFFYALLALSIGELIPERHFPHNARLDKSVLGISVLLLVLVVVLPVVIQRSAKTPEVTPLPCSAEQTSYAIYVNQGSYFDLHPKGWVNCGHVPDICINDFRSNARVSDIADVAAFEKIISQAETWNVPTRVTVANNLLDGRLLYFVGPSEELPEGLVTGCATEFKVKTRPGIYVIESGNLQTSE